ncbi:MAG: hypothetical protein WDW19_02030 [Neisseriaceae bacterium]
MKIAVIDHGQRSRSPLNTVPHVYPQMDKLSPFSFNAELNNKEQTAGYYKSQLAKKNQTPLANSSANQLLNILSKLSIPEIARATPAFLRSSPYNFFSNLHKTSPAPAELLSFRLSRPVISNDSARTTISDFPLGYDGIKQKTGIVCSRLYSYTKKTSSGCVTICKEKEV